MVISKNENLYIPLQQFAAAVHTQFKQIVIGAPEDQLRTPFVNFMEAAGSALIPNQELVCTGEVRTSEGRPDYAISLDKLLAGYVELKAPGKGATEAKLKGKHDKAQFKRFSAIPNLLYTDGNEWVLYHSGEQRDIVRLSGDIASEGKKAITAEDAQKLHSLLLKFLHWNPASLIPRTKSGLVDLQGFAEQLAPLCRLLRDDVTEALAKENSLFHDLAADWRQLLFPEASDEKFADAYAQTVTFALLLGRTDGADPLTIESAVDSLSADHSLLSRALKVLTLDDAQKELSASLNLLVRFIGALPIQSMDGGKGDPWLYFYEEFLSAYDPELRKDAGAYYTPVQVVHAQVRLIDDLLVNRLGKPLGFANEDVVTLDPAAGTGTYLLGVVEHALGRIEKEQGPGALKGQANLLAKNLHGFEIMVGPYAVCELRVSRALKEKQADLSAGTNIFLTDTLESPNAQPKQIPVFYKPISDQHKQAIKVKNETPVIVCLGNPPYKRVKSTGEEGQRLGGWVLCGDPDNAENRPILKDFIEPAQEAGHGVHIKNLYNLYVYFWRWILWKVFEHDSSAGPGVVSFISASSYIDGDAFSGMREQMRKQCDEIWILDLGGEGRGTRQSDNVFNILTPVAIAVAVRKGKVNTKSPAKVHYSKFAQDRETKLQELDNIHSIADVEWEDCPDDWQAPFRPAGTGSYFDNPLLTDLMPWQHSGVELKRTWPIGPNEKVLNSRWRELLKSSDRSLAFRGSGDREISGKYSVVISGKVDPTPIAALSSETPILCVNRYAFRSFDRQYVIGDGRLIARPRPDLWNTISSNQVLLTSLFNHPLGSGSALTACCNIPDRHHLRGSYGGKDVIPLFRTADATEPNILPGLLDLLSETYDQPQAYGGILSHVSGRIDLPITPEDFLAYVYGLLAQSAFTSKFRKELETREVRVPLTKDAKLFAKVRDAGAHLLWLHTYGERYIPKGKQAGHVPGGKAKCVRAVPSESAAYPEEFSLEGTTLRVGAGEFAPVSSEVFDFEVSGLKVVQSWLGYRMKAGKGKKSSPLDDIRPEQWTAQFTTELLQLLWVLEATLASYPKQAALLDEVLKGKLFTADELPEVPDEMRKPPKVVKPKKPELFDD